MISTHKQTIIIIPFQLVLLKIATFSNVNSKLSKNDNLK